MRNSDLLTEAFVDFVLDRTVNPLMEGLYTPSLSVVITHQGKRMHRAYGSTRPGRPASKPDPQKTLFETGSFGKTVTALLLAESVRRKEADLETPLAS